MSPVPVYKIGEENHANYIEVVELKERNSYDTSKPHRHEYIEVFLFSKGGGIHDIDFKAYDIENNSAHFVFPNQIHKVKRALNTNGHVILVSKEYFSGLDYDLFVEFFHAFYLDATLGLNAKSFEKIVLLLSEIKTELEVKTPYYQSIVKDLLHLIIKLFLRGNLMTDKVKDEANKDFKQYMNLLLLVEDNFKLHQPVSFYSEALQISIRKLNEICNHLHLGSCSTVIQDRIVLEAKKLLVYEEVSVKDVMYALNYKDAAYFNRFFKSKTGITPSAYKKEYANKYHK